MPIKVVLFDLGGVIVRLGDTIFPPHWLQQSTPFSLAEWLASPTSKAFETGSISAREFAHGLKKDLALRQSAEEIIQHFTAWPQGLFPGSTKMLSSLKQSYTLAALSNINELHVPRMLEEFRLHEFFDELFFSNELGLAKPDSKIYLKAIELLGVAAEEVVFFDDVENNVNAALEVGLNAHQVFGPDLVLSHLEKY